MRDTTDIVIGETTVRFKKLTRRIRGRVEESARAWSKERRADSLRLAGYDGEDLAERLNLYDCQPVAVPELLAFLNTPSGLDFALRAHMVDEAQADLLDELENAEEVLCGLWGFTRSAPATAEATEATADPTKPLTFGS